VIKFSVVNDYAKQKRAETKSFARFEPTNQRQQKRRQFIFLSRLSMVEPRLEDARALTSNATLGRRQKGVNAVSRQDKFSFMLPLN
jgi:hypothetical protein